MTQFPPVRYDIIPLAGGMDQVTPTLALKPGVCRRAVNFEVAITGGYSRIEGYERFDGRARPSDAQYGAMVCTITGSVTAGITLTGATSGATGKVIYVSGVTVVVTRVTGTFTAGENLTNGSTVASLVSYASMVADGATDALYRSLAAAEYRTSIGKVPGSGPTLGVGYYAGNVYAWRNNASGTAADMYKSTPSGWVQVTLGEEVAFTNANVNVNDGDVLTQGGVTATVRRVVVQTGSLASGTNTGRLIITGRTGGNFAAGAATSTGAGALTLSGVQTAITFLPNGKYDSTVANFGGGSSRKRLYWVDGVNRCHEFDGTTVVPISTGMTVDAPTYLVAHKQKLFLTFDYSLQFSATGDPYSWSPIVGAGEIAMNDTITNLIVLPGDQTNGALGVFTRVDTSILYGSSAATFSLTPFNNGTGAIAGMGQNLDQTYILTDQGVMSLATTKNYGNFSPSTLTNQVRPFVKQHLVAASTSGLNREKGQYRIFFSDGYGMYLTLRNGIFSGAMPVQFPDPVLCTSEGQRADGTRTSYFGSTSGYVFEMDAGTSFDGADIAASINLVFNSSGNARILKRYRKASVELTGSFFASFSLGYDLGYRTQAKDQMVDISATNDLRSAYWDTFTWDNFVWDGQDISPTEMEVTGSAENIAFRVSTVSAVVPAFTVNSVTLHFTPRRGLR